jgi:hypothetical protein
MKVTSIEGKIKEASMREHDHVMRRDDDYIMEKTLDIQEKLLQEEEEDHNCG